MFTIGKTAMRAALLIIFFYFRYGHCLWPKGVVHYAISTKDYDMHSQDEIQSVLSQIQKEICVKFFYTPFNVNASTQEKVLYISNPEKLKNCPQYNYDYSRSVVDMPIGYKCFNQKDIARIVVDMLRASIEPTQSVVNSYDLVKTFRTRDDDTSRPGLLAPSDRNYINAHYHHECGALAAPAPAPSRRGGDVAESVISEATQLYYQDKVWPLGVVMYEMAPSYDKPSTDPSFSQLYKLKLAMATIEYSTCVVFQNVDQADAVLDPKNLLYFDRDGKDEPALGFTLGNQTLKLSSFVTGAPGHDAHVLNNLMRVLGVPMMSNRCDRDNYVSVNWNHVRKGKEHLLEKIPEEAWIKLAYDFTSVTHAPVNYMCGAECELGAQTVQPVQDHLWQRTTRMGRQKHLSDTDKQIVNLLYGKECERRYANKDFTSS